MTFPTVRMKRLASAYRMTSVFELRRRGLGRILLRHVELSNFFQGDAAFYQVRWRAFFGNAKLFEMRRSYPGCGGHPSFVGSPAGPKVAPKRRRVLCKMQENVDLSPLKSSSLPLSRLRSAIFNITNPLPPPVTITRRNLDRDFAVLLMRSGYQTVDDLDFVAMDRFQQEFFEIRSLAWEKWIKVNAGMRQGLLTDPRYFDFISYAQMLTIQKFMREPYAVFEERYNVVDGEWDTRVLQRDITSLAVPQDILNAFRKDLGDKIYARMLNTVRYPIPVDDGDIRKVLNGIKAIYGYFQIAGFCFKLDIGYDVESGTCTVDMVAPAILWSVKALRQLRDKD